MATLKVKYLYYHGDDYFYKSPFLDSGLNIIEGYNGAGKTTFMNLLYYCFGGSVSAFTKEETKQIEVYNDKNNKVEIGVVINDEDYIFSRYIKSNTIAVQKDDEITVFPVYRTGEETIFSDWLLYSLGISVFSVYQGISDWKINFLDLMRLIFHDQADFLGEVYKKPDKKENFINDSPVIKKAIFEVLLGHNGDKYYKAFNELKELEKQKNVTNSSYQKYKEIAENLRYTNDWKELNLSHIDEKIESIKEEIDKINIYKSALREKPKKVEKENIKIDELKSKIIIAENELDEINQHSFYLSNEIRNIENVYKETLEEINTLEKILYTHDSYDFFHSNTCPICLKEVERDEGICICGNPINEDDVNTIFYETEEYLDLLNSKKKSIETISLAKKSCLSEMDSVSLEKAKIKQNISEFRENIEDNLKTIDDRFDNSLIIEAEKRQIELTNSLNSFSQQRNVEKQLTGLEEQLNNLKELYKTKDAIVRKLAAELEIELNEKINSFNSIYSAFLQETLEDCRSAFLNEDYYPVINGGTYRERSAIVPIRLMYYFTFLKLSIERDDIAFPRFLLIDTPETAGIDDENLLKCLNQIDKIVDEKTNFQIILTTGLNKYPEKYKNLVKQSIHEGEHLLKRQSLE